MITLVAILPIAVVLVLMVVRRWSAAQAGGVGALVACVAAALAFGFPAGTAEGGAVREVGGVLAETGFTALTILWIIGPALGIHQLQMRTGAAETLRSALGAFASDPRILALLVAWFFVLFMEGVAGFGSSVALAAPFLVAAGFRPVEAVSIALVGHVVGVSFGAIGTPIIPQMAATGISGRELAAATGIYHSLLGWIPLAIMVRWVNRSQLRGGASAGGTGAASTRGWTLAAFVCFLVPYTLLWRFVGPELPTVGGALFGGTLFILLLVLWRRPGTGPGSGPESHAAEPPGAVGPAEHVRPPGVVLRAAAPYLALIALVLVTRLVPQVREPLRAVEVAWAFNGFSGSILPLHHPGSMLLAGFLMGALLQRAPWKAVRQAFLETTRRLLPVTAALVSMLLISRIMVHAGMTEALAAAAATHAGGAWPALAPLVGVLGTFVTGSATASNILFTDLQAETALLLGLPVAAMAGAQGFGAAVGNMICPHNVVAAGATVGLEGREGEILRRTLGAALLYAGAGGVLALVLTGMAS